MSTDTDRVNVASVKHETDAALKRKAAQAREVGANYLASLYERELRRRG